MISKERKHDLRRGRRMMSTGEDLVVERIKDAASDNVTGVK